MRALVEAGFVDRAGARRAVRRLRLRTRLLYAQHSIPALLDSLNQTGDAMGDALAPCLELTAGDLECAVSGQSVNLIECQDMREQQLLKGVDLVLQFLDALQEMIGQGCFSSNRVSAEARPADPVGHCLSGGAK